MWLIYLLWILVKYISSSHIVINVFYFLKKSDIQTFILIITLIVVVVVILELPGT